MTEEQQPHDTGMRDIPKKLRPYFLGLLLKGKRWNETDGQETQALLTEHLAFLRQQIELRHYVFAGPATQEGEIVGIAMIEASNYSAAVAIAESDPGVQAGRLRVQVHPVLLPSLEGIKVTY